jgi:hypothetical protein
LVWELSGLIPHEGLHKNPGLHKKALRMLRGATFRSVYTTDHVVASGFANRATKDLPKTFLVGVSLYVAAQPDPATSVFTDFHGFERGIFLKSWLDRVAFFPIPAVLQPHLADDSAHDKTDRAPYKSASEKGAACSMLFDAHAVILAAERDLSRQKRDDNA